MIEAGRYTQSAVDACIVFCRYARDSARLQKGDQLIAPRIKKNVPQAPAFLDLYRVSDYRLESQNALVKLPRLVQVKGRGADMGESFMTHDYHSLRNARSLYGRGDSSNDGFRRMT